MKKVRDALPPRPNIPNIPYGASAEAKEQIIRTAQDKYIDMISGYCDLIQELDSLEDCRNFPNRVKEEGVSTTLPKSKLKMSRGKRENRHINLHLLPRKKNRSSHQRTANSLL